MTYTIPEGEAQVKEYDGLDLKIKLNLSASRMGLKKYREVLDYCYQVSPWS
jgi:hypothetical protein